METPLSFPLEPGSALAVFALVAIGSCIQSSVGFGLGLTAAPLLFLTYPPLVPGPLMASSLALMLLIAFRGRAGARPFVLGLSILAALGILYRAVR